MKFYSLLVLSILLQLPAVFGQVNPNRMAWWQDAKFGLFIHWGLYSVTAGDWKGKPTRGGEHFMLYERIPVKEYGEIAKSFNPEKFNADQWVKYAKDAGMKYIVITTKHHDGYAMYNSASSDYNIVKTTPFKKDPITDLAASCRKYGLKLCFYYSLGRDWEDPDVPTNWPVKAGRSNSWDYPNEDAKDLSKYFERKVKPQIKELLTQYGPIGVIWFDTPELITRQQSTELASLIHELQPNCLINSRIGNGLGDFQVSEQKLTVEGNMPAWESCITMSANWGYNRHDKAWKSPELIVRNLIEVLSKGGNLLLNVGPTGEGLFPEPAVKNLKAVGEWMAVNQEAIYGTHPLKVGETPIMPKAEEKKSDDVNTIKDAVNDQTSKKIEADLRFTAKGSFIYLFARSWTAKDILLSGFQNRKVKKITLIGSKAQIKWTETPSGIAIKLTDQLPEGIPVYVFKLKI